MHIGRKGFTCMVMIYKECFKKNIQSVFLRMLKPLKVQREDYWLKSL